VLAVARLVIRPEERYLTERFGQTYADYRAQVRRWL
jgi:protein-S-isoprenylcysteine O-methyltransferase Ste14